MSSDVSHSHSDDDILDICLPIVTCILKTHQRPNMIQACTTVDRGCSCSGAFDSSSIDMYVLELFEVGDEGVHMYVCGVSREVRYRSAY